MTARKRRVRGGRWYHRIGLVNGILVLLLVLVGFSLLLGPWFRSQTASAGKVPQVQVLNGSRVRGLAGQVAEHLRDEGFDVVSVGNADSDEYSQTLVLLRRGEIATAHRVAQVLGAGHSLEQLDSTLLLDVTIILGADYQAPEGGTSPTEAADQAVQ